MTTARLLAYWPAIVTRCMRKWWLRRQLAHIGYTLKHIQQQRENDRHVERILQGRQALLSSELRQI